MGWLYNKGYVGPNRRGGRFQIRFLERRKRDAEEGTRASTKGALSQLFANGMKWVDTMTYFGPDRRGAFSHFLLERRKQEVVGAPPRLHAALRQLRMRLLEAQSDESRPAFLERMRATALLADAQGRGAIGDVLTRLADQLEAGGMLGSELESELLTAEAMLSTAGPAR